MLFIMLVFNNQIYILYISTIFSALPEPLASQRQSCCKVSQMKTWNLKETRTHAKSIDMRLADSDGASCYVSQKKLTRLFQKSNILY